MSQATATAITIPSAAPAAATVYVPVIHSHRIGAEYLPELPVEATTRAAVIADIASGQHDGVSRVMAFDIAQGRAWDASREIAVDVLDRVLDKHDEVSSWVRDFLETHLGVHHVCAAESFAA